MSLRLSNEEWWFLSSVAGYVLHGDRLADHDFRNILMMMPSDAERLFEQLSDAEVVARIAGNHWAPRPGPSSGWRQGDPSAHAAFRIVVRNSRCQTASVDVRDQRPVRQITANEDAPRGSRSWPASIPAVRQLLDQGLELSHGVTLLVGENGSGKSTLVEAVAMAYGLSPEGGSTQARHGTYETESELWRWLRLERSPGAPRWGFFLRAETMHGFYTYLADNPGGNPDEPEFHRLSHGESFLEVLRTRFDTPGLYCLDEPEAALSFSAQIALVATLHELAARGAQVLCATHSPLLASLPDARILEIGDWGARPSTYDDLELVTHWRNYLAEPMRYLRHVL